MLTWCSSAVNFSFPFCFAALRTRSSPLRPLSRRGVRCELGSGVFSLVSGLPSTTSAGGCPLLFGCFVGTTPLYDSPGQSHRSGGCRNKRYPPRHRAWRTYGSSPSPPGPHTSCGRRRDLPVLAHGVSLHAWGLRLRGTAPHSRYRDCAMLPSEWADAVGFPKPLITELNTQPTDTPVQRFKCDVTAALTWLGARVARYAFSVRLFHSLLHAGL